MKVEDKIVMGYGMAYVGITQWKCATHQFFHRQYYASLGVGWKLEDWSVLLEVHIAYG